MLAGLRKNVGAPVEGAAMVPTTKLEIALLKGALDGS